MTHTSTKGFTLIEAIIYLALFTIVIGGLIASAYAFFESNGRNQSHAMLQEEQNFLIAKIDFALDGAKTVTLANPSTLTVTKYDGTTVTLTQSGTDLTYDSAVLNNSNVTVGNLVFIHAVTAGINAPESIEAGFALTTHTPNGMLLTQTASTTRYIRK